MFRVEIFYFLYSKIQKSQLVVENARFYYLMILKRLVTKALTGFNPTPSCVFYVPFTHDFLRGKLGGIN